MLKKTLKLAGIGFLLGIVICHFISILTGTPELISGDYLSRIGDLRAALLLQMLITGLYGAVNIGSTMIYKAERLPLLVSSLIHCSIVIIPFIPMSFFFGWVTDAVSCLIMSAFQFAAYFIIWLIIYIRYRREIKKLNALQDQLQDKPNKQKGGNKK